MAHLKRTETFNLAYRFVTETRCHVFLTGKAGTGKTTFLRYLREHCTKELAVAAPTGVAAINAGGVTLHSLFQLPFIPFVPARSEHPNTVGSHNIRAQIHYHKNKINLLRSLELLIIDEASMVPSHTVDAIDTLLKSVRRKPGQPFGGVQVLFIGDLHQLPPVVKREEWQVLQQYYRSPFFFDSHILRDNPPVTIELKTIFRQQDKHFIRVLNDIRNNTLSQQSLDLLNTRYKPGFSPPKGEGYITLTTHNKQADQINEAKLHKLDGKAYTYEAEISGDFPERNAAADPALTLKKGAQVMFVKNDVEERKYYNGKVGVVTGLENDKIFVKGKDDNETVRVPQEVWRNIRYTYDAKTGEINEEELGSFRQYPLRLAWAVTIHKSQGLTFDKLVVDAQKAFATGQVYVALSRCTSLEGLVLRSRVNRRFLGAHQSLRTWMDHHHREHQLPDTLQRARQQYAVDELKDIFTWPAWYRHLHELRELIYEEREELPIDSLPWVKSLIEQQRKLHETARKFKAQIDTLLKDHAALEKNKALQGRIRDAAAYFEKEIGAWQEAFRQHPLSTEKVKVGRPMDKAMQQIQTFLHHTLHRMQYLCKGFSLQDYLEKGKKARGEAPKPPSTYAGKQRQPVTSADSKHPKLYSQLADLRRRLAGDDEDRPLYTIFSNRALKNVCEHLPANKDALLQVKGFGPAKVGEFGDAVLEVVRHYCKEHHLEAQQEIELPPKPLQKTPTLEKTVSHFHQGKDIKAIANARNLAVSTIEGHMVKAITLGEVQLEAVLPAEEVQQITQQVQSIGDAPLSTIKEALPAEISYGKIRMVLAAMKGEEVVAGDK